MLTFIHWSFFATLLLLSASVYSETKNDNAFHAINQRLSHMQDVARYKYVNAIPVENRKREKLVIEKAVAQAGLSGLKPESVTAFFEAQIVVAKAIQRRYHQQWLKDKSDNKDGVVSLDSTRAALITLGNEIIELLAARVKAHGPFTEKNYSEFATVLNVHLLVEKDKRMLFDALKAIRVDTQK